MSGWFQAQVVHTGRLPLFCFFVAFVTGFTAIRVSVRLIRAGVRWWPGNLVAGAVHVHHMVFGVVLMAAGGIAGLAAPPFSLAWRGAAAGVFGLGSALVLDEFALILHLQDVTRIARGEHQCAQAGGKHRPARAAPAAAAAHAFHHGFHPQKPRFRRISQ